MKTLGPFLRAARERRAIEDSKRFSLRQVSMRVGMEPSYLSKIENGITDSISEESAKKFARELGVDEIELLAHAGKISSDVLEIIHQHPRAFADLILALRNSSEHTILRIVREVTDGDW